MTNPFNKEADNKEGLEKEPSSPEDLGHEQSEIPSSQENQVMPASNHARKAGLSKREIMEELSRARFPWDE